MTSQRPTVAPHVVAAIIELTPDRVRRRLDQSPDAAAGWNWQECATTWSVDTGGETVTLPLGHVASAEQVACTCLLSPRCFHVLACLARLEVALAESATAEPQEHPEPTSTELAEDVLEPDERQRRAARELVDGIARLLRVGVANAGVVVQFGLLRAVHQCRAEGLHRLAALGLRVIAGTKEFRRRAPSSDPAQLAEDMAESLETICHLLQPHPVSSFWVGTARRKQMPVRPRKLHGLFAEPIITRSGFGAAAYFLGEDDRIYTASDVRPGDAQQARDAYLGGIEIGPLIQPARQLARGLYVGTDLTASQDGRLGRGKGVRIAEQGQSTWQNETVQMRFCRPLPDQWNAIYAHSDLPPDARPAGWDLVFVVGTVLGAAGPELFFQPSHGPPIRLAIESEAEPLCFRENLRMLSHAPGLRLLVIARVNLQDPRIAAALAIAPTQDSQQEGAVRLDVHSSLAGRICLGFDEIQRHHLVHAQASAVVLSAEAIPPDDDPLHSLRRRWIAVMLSGLDIQRPSHSLLAEQATLARFGFTTAAMLIDALASADAGRTPTAIDTFLATAIYLRNATCSLAESRATLES